MRNSSMVMLTAWHKHTDCVLHCANHAQLVSVKLWDPTIAVQPYSFLACKLSHSSCHKSVQGCIKHGIGCLTLKPLLALSL